MTDNDPAVEAAYVTIRRLMGGTYTVWALAEDAVAAARPIIEAEVRERIAADIEAAVDPEWPNDDVSRAYKDAARIARGET